MYRGKNNSQVNIQCPYFLGETEKSIICEGACIGCRNKSMFESEDKKDTYIVRHCFKYPNECWLSKTNDARYM